MRAGQLRHKITIKKFDGSRNDYNEKALSYSTVATVWAEKLMPRGREFVKSGVETGAATVLYRIRYRSDVTTEMVVEDGDGVEYDIEAALDEEGRKRELVLACVVRD